MRRSWVIGAALVVLGGVGGGIAWLLTGTGGANSTGTTTTVAPPPTATTAPTATAPSTPHRMLVGVVEISALERPGARPKVEVARARRAGFDSLMLQAYWNPGLTRPRHRDLEVLRRAVRAAVAAHMRLFVIVGQSRPRAVPLTASRRGQYASFAASVARSLPDVHDFVVGNEPNLDGFWLPQYGPGGSDAAASAYEALLAQTYDALKAVSPKIDVVGGALAPHGSDNPARPRPTHSPTQFVRDLAAAYRASGRDRPIMDSFALHPYMRFSRIAPTLRHPTSTTITVADYPKLVALLGDAFAGTAQPGANLPIYYTEFGVQTRVPRAKLRFYTDLDSTVASDAVSPATQGEWYRRALALAACQPTVRGFFVFHTVDEIDLKGWQSGVYYADGTPKPSLGVVRKAAEDVRAGRIGSCRSG